MPRYYFEIDDNGVMTPDEEGIECETLASVRDAAIDALPRMASDVLPDGDHHIITILVRDQAGRSIFKASLTLEAGWQQG
ncbi:MAG TPA: hypothetical protein VGO17_01285 [Aurantimonas sp.]|nr:hypothetical protein [Aurantimonas sp.]